MEGGSIEEKPPTLKGLHHGLAPSLLTAMLAYDKRYVLD
jgi:hypothetical protein